MGSYLLKTKHSKGVTFITIVKPSLDSGTGAMQLYIEEVAQKDVNEHTPKAGRKQRLLHCSSLWTEVAQELLTSDLSLWKEMGEERLQKD